MMRASTVAVRSALAVFAMMQGAVCAAEEMSDEIRELTQRSNQIEVGIGNVSKGSYKFGEYNGQQKDGVFGNAGFELNGGGIDTAFRWQAYGKDLGLDTRSLGVDIGTQGSYRFKWDYDELRRNYDDSFHTIFQGAGSTSLTLPAGALPPAASRLSTTTTAGGVLSNWNNAQAPNANATQNTPGGGPGYIFPTLLQNGQFDIATQRKKHDLDLGLVLTPQWDAKLTFRNEDKEGTKLTGVAFGGPGLGLMGVEPVSNNTRQLGALLNFAGEKGHFNVNYSGSWFSNDINRWTVENPFSNLRVTNNLAVLGSAPDNQMHRLGLAGAYSFSKTTRLVVGGSYTRMTQDDAYQYQAGPAGSNWTVPANSANAKVINTNFNARLTARPLKELNLSAAYKYEDRDNRTPINTYRTVGGDATGAASFFTNEPINRRQQQGNLDADYSLGRGNAVKAGYEWQQIKRSDDTSAATVEPAYGTALPVFHAEKTTEHTLRVEYRNSMAEALNGRIGYARSQRRSSEYEDGVLPAINPPTGSGFPSADPLAPGFKQFFLADRNRDKLRAALNFQASDALSFQSSLDFNQDSYNNSPLGLKDSKNWVFSLDGALAASENLSFNAYYTYEDQKARLDGYAIPRATLTSPTATIATTPHVAGSCSAYTNTGPQPSDYQNDPCRNWSSSQADMVHTFGLAVRAKGLMSGKLELMGDIAYSRARSPNSMSGGAYFNSAVPSSATGNGYIAAQNLPDVTSSMWDLRLGSKYALDKSSAIRFNYQMRRLHSSDYMADAFSNYLSMQGYIPTGQTSANYTVHLVGVSYVYSFR